MDDPIVWQTVDRLGRVVLLTRSAWTHVLDGHPELAGREIEARDAVALSDEIVRDRRFAHREIHRRERGQGQPATVVVVHYRPTPDGWTGRVITTFRRTTPEKGERRWPRPTS